MKLVKLLLGDELADEYDKCRPCSRGARTFPMDAIFEWAKMQTDKFHVSEKEGTVHKIIS